MRCGSSRNVSITAPNPPWTQSRRCPSVSLSIAAPVRSVEFASAVWSIAAMSCKPW
jgi:hypothetical protein